MKNNSKNIKAIIFTIALVVLPFAVQVVSAQVGPPPIPVTPPTGVPIDGGIALLLAGLGGYAYKKFKGEK